MNRPAELNVRRATTLVQEGQYRRALQALNSAGMADYSEDTLEEMKAKHPAPFQQQPPLPNADAPARAFSVPEVAKAALSFQMGTAAGPSGMRPEHLRVVLKCLPATVADKAQVALTKLVNVIAKGKVPATVAPFFCGARLHAAKKKDNTLRPIAVGNLLRRLVAKCFSTALADRASALLAPLQLGVAVRNGCEAIAHAVRAAVEEDPSRWVLLKYGGS